MRFTITSLGPVLGTVALVLSLVSCATTPSSGPAPAEASAPSRFVQSPEILDLERQVSQDPGVREVLGRWPATKLKLLPQGDVLRVFVAQQRDGKWFNITKQLPQADLARIEVALDRVGGASGKWKVVPLGTAASPALP